MANIVVTSDTEKIFVQFNDYSLTVGYVEGYFNRNNIESVQLRSDSLSVMVTMNSSSEIKMWDLVYSSPGTGQMIVDSVNGTSPIDNEHLQDLIAALIKA